MARKRPRKSSILSLILLIAVIALFVRMLTAPSTAQCPRSREGNENASLIIKYFDSPYCAACWTEKPILEKLVKEHRSLFLLEKYDIDDCKKIARSKGIGGPPGWIFNSSGNETIHVGFIPEEVLTEIIGQK